MALVQIFSCPRTLARLRCAPLGELLEGFAQWLIEHQFSRSTLRQHRGYLSHFNRYLGGLDPTPRQEVRRQDVDGFSPGHGDSFLLDSVADVSPFRGS
jgi:hypothetical protein